MSPISFREFVSDIRRTAEARGVRLSFSKLNNAVAYAYYNKAYSQVVAAERAGKLAARIDPPQFVAQAAARYKIEIEDLENALASVAQTHSIAETSEDEHHDTESLIRALRGEGRVQEPPDIEEISEEEFEEIYTSVDTTSLLKAVDIVDELRDHLNDLDGLRPPEIREDLMKLHGYGMELVNHGARAKARKFFELAADIDWEISEIISRARALQDIFKPIMKACPESLT